nr:MAG TPA: hypothetical protein [Caudoviricetes sp.]
MSTAYITTKSIREYNRVKINIALCEARHQMPEHVTGSIFPNTVDPLDIEGITAIADDFMSAHTNDDVNVYVTGLTVCTVAIIKAAMMRLATDKACPTLTLWHFDRATGDYYPQTIISAKEQAEVGDVILFYAYNC